LYESESDIDILRLARAVNLDIDQELRRLKDKVRTGLKELEQKGYLEQYQITKDNRVIISKSKDSGLKELEQKGYLEQYQITKDNRVIISKSKDSAAHFQSQILDSDEMSYLSE